MEIVALRPDDWELLKAVRLRALKESPRAFTSTHSDEALRDEADWRKTFTDAVWVVARLNGAPIGVARSVREPDRPASERHVQSVWVDPDHRRQGVARRMFQALTEIERETGVVDLRVWVIEGNDAAKDAYERLGFVPTGERAPVNHSSKQWERRLSLWIGPSGRPTPSR